MNGDNHHHSYDKHLPTISRYYIYLISFFGVFCSKHCFKTRKNNFGIWRRTWFFFDAKFFFLDVYYFLSVLMFFLVIIIEIKRGAELAGNYKILIKIVNNW